MKERPIIFSGPMVRAILEGRKTQTRRLIRLPDNVVEGPRYWTTPSGRPQGGYADPGVNYWTPSGNHIDPCPYGFPGDRLWVRETFCPVDDTELGGERWIDYRATPRYSASHPAGWDNAPKDPGALKWRPAIHMPRTACRLVLEVTEIRVQRLQEISEDDAKAEGAFFTHYGRQCGHKVGRGWSDVGNCQAPEHTHPQRPGWSMVPTTGPDQCLHSARMAFANLWDRINAKRAPWASNPWVWVVEFRRLP